MHAAGINPPGWYVRGGLTSVPGETTPSFALPMIPGTDVSGVVESMGAGVDGFAAGDEIFGLLRFPSLHGGGYAQYVAAPAADLAHKPAGSTTCMPWRPDGGAHVVAVASGTHEEFLRKLGADEFIDYTRNNPADLAHGLDLVLDTVGGSGSGRFLRSLKRGGALFQVLPAAVDQAEAASLDITVSSAQVRSNGAQLAELGHLIDAGIVRVAIDSTFPLDLAQAAHEQAARGISREIVLTVG